MSLDDYDEIEEQLYRIVSNPPELAAEVEASHAKLLTLVDQATKDGQVRSSIEDTLREVAKHLWFTYRRNPTWTQLLTKRLADHCRDHEVFRDLYGLQKRLTPEEYQATKGDDTEPDCILEVARRMVMKAKRERDSNLKDSLRLIANCCADNNPNRALIMYRDTFATLTRNAAAGLETNLSVATLFNVCIDYDEPARKSSGEEYTHLASRTEEEIPFTMADQLLATCFDQRSVCTKTELLVDAGTYCDDQVLPNLCDLVEMSTRLATYDFTSFLPPTQLEAKTFRCIQLLENLVFTGRKFAANGPDCRQSICQAVLNLMSSDEIQEHFLTMSAGKTLEAIMQLPYHGTKENLNPSLAFYQTAFLRMLYSLSTKPQFSVTYAFPSQFQVYCIKNVARYHAQMATAGRGDHHLHPTFVAGLLGLLANMTTTKERAEMLVNQSDLAVHLAGVIEREEDSSVMIPALNLAGRMALSPDGQSTLLKFLRYPKLSNCLARYKSASSVQREIIALQRYLIKGSSELVLWVISAWMASTNHQRNPSSLDVMLSMFATTKDEGVKVEVGKLLVEVLRTTFASKTSEGRHSDQVAKSFFTLATRQHSDSFLNPVEFLVQQGGSISNQAEGWFAFAILSTSHLGRRLVSNMLSTPEMLDVLDNVIKTPEEPILANVKLMMANLRSEPEVIPEEVRKDLQRMMVELGLSLSVEAMKTPLLHKSADGVDYLGN